MIDSLSTSVVRFSIVTPVFNPPQDAFESCVQSVIAQTYPNWEWCLVDDCSTAPWIRQRLLDLQARDSRIRVHFRKENGGIVAASNDALSLASGQFVALLDNDDVLHSTALACVAEVINADPTIDYIYTDEDKINADGVHYDQFDKPRWSPERFLTQNYCGHLSVIRKTLVDKVGRFRAGFDGAQDYDILLRITEQARQIAHVPVVLYHQQAHRGSEALAELSAPDTLRAKVRAVESALERRGISATVRQNLSLHCHTIVRHLQRQPYISIIIPTCGTFKPVFGVDTCLVVNAVQSILAKSTYQNFEILVIIDDNSPSHAWDALRTIADERVRLIPYNKPFNFSSKCNLGAALANGGYLLLLNDDTEIIDADWLEIMASHLEDPDVAMVGPMLLLEDGRIQSAGHSNTPQPHNFRSGTSVNNPGEFSILAVARECSGVTGACALIRRSAYEKVGGMSSIFPLAFNDVDFSFKLLNAGYRIVWTPHARLFHFETASRPKSVEPLEVQLLLERWKTKLTNDEYCRLS
jgi:GT2 family glycosyltransferase